MDYRLPGNCQLVNRLDGKSRISTEKPVSRNPERAPMPGYGDPGGFSLPISCGHLNRLESNLWWVIVIRLSTEPYWLDAARVR